MSYDIIIFDPAVVPTTDEAFATWKNTLFTRDEDPSFQPGAQSPAIAALYDAARDVFPTDGDTPAKFFCDFDHLEITFADADAQVATQWIQDYATNHGLGLYDVGSTDQVTLPD